MLTSDSATKSRIRTGSPRARESYRPAEQRRPTLICFSHLRWNFVFQRPQHLMTRFAANQPVIFFEEPIVDEQLSTPSLSMQQCSRSGVIVVTPRVPMGEVSPDTLQRLLDGLLDDRAIVRPVLWYYTPMMRSFSRHIDAAAVVYDCMDELANFRFAPSGLQELERELIADADLMLTGGYSLYEAKRDQHHNIHPFPSSVDLSHFHQARHPGDEPEDQRPLPRPRLGFYGVIDERIDLPLLAALADARPQWQIVMVGPLAKISPDDLPRRPNIHWLGAKTYEELPRYLGGWDVALMPFAINASTQFISPTKTPEFLAGGCPVVSTAITDVKRGYGDLDAVCIAANDAEFIAGCDRAFALHASGFGWRDAADRCLAGQSWDRTHAAIAELVDAVTTRAPRRISALTASASRRAAYDDVIVGAGFAGSVLAERLARGANRRVLLIDRRPHIGGNAYDRRNADGLMIHQYGPHIFHTNSERIFRYLSRFTEWRGYDHRVLAAVDGQLLPVPINRTTINKLYDLELQTAESAEAFLRAHAEPILDIRTAEDVVLSSVGTDLYRRFFQGYTRKQWGRDPSRLDKAVTARVPVRFDTDDRYFTDRFQFMPRDGYTAMFENMLDHPNITVELGVDFADVREEVRGARVIYSGPVDEFFDYRYGPLPYRSLRFEHRTLHQEWLQPVAVINYPDETIPYTRVTEYKHLTGQQHRWTSITHEFPTDFGDPYYPVPCPENQELYRRYEALAERTSGVTFVGRLGTYRYYNMDQVVGQALATYNRLVPATATAEAGSAVRVADLELAG